MLPEELNHKAQYEYDTDLERDVKIDVYGSWDNYIQAVINSNRKKERENEDGTKA